MAHWIDIVKLADLPPGEKICAHGVMVANVGGSLHAIENVCPHAGLPLGDGDLAGKVITCPYHGYAYRVDTGVNVDYADDTPVRTLPVRVENDTIQVDLER